MKPGDYDPERERSGWARVGAGGQYGDELEEGDRPVPSGVGEPRAEAGDE